VSQIGQIGQLDRIQQVTGSTICIHKQKLSPKTVVVIVIYKSAKATQRFGEFWGPPGAFYTNLLGLPATILQQ